MPEKLPPSERSPEQPEHIPKATPEMIDSWQNKYEGRLIKSINKRAEIKEYFLANSKHIQRNKSLRENMLDTVRDQIYKRDVAIGDFWRRNNLSPLDNPKDFDLHIDVIKKDLTTEQITRLMEKMANKEDVLQAIKDEDSSHPQLTAFLQEAETKYYEAQDKVLGAVLKGNQLPKGRFTKERILIRLIEFMVAKKMKILQEDESRNN